jgi:hypothetical protein
LIVKSKIPYSKVMRPPNTLTDAFSGVIGDQRGTHISISYVEAVDRLLARADVLSAEELEALPYNGTELADSRNRASKHIEDLGRHADWKSANKRIYRIVKGIRGAEQALNDTALVLMTYERLSKRDATELSAAIREHPSFQGLLKDFDFLTPKAEVTSHLSELENPEKSDEGTISCPICGYRVPDGDTWAEIHHMEANHPEVIEERRRAIH